MKREPGGNGQPGERAARAETWLSVLVGLVAGLGMLVASTALRASAPLVSHMLLIVGSLLIGSIAVALIEQRVLRKSWQLETLELLRKQAPLLGVEIRRVLEREQAAARQGLVGITRRLWNEVEYPELVRQAREEIDLFEIHGRRFFSTSLDALREWLPGSGGGRRLRVVLPNPENASLIAFLAWRSGGWHPDQLAQRIRDAASAVVSLQRVSPKHVQLFYANQPPAYSYYRFDDFGIVYVHANAAQGTAPSNVALLMHGLRTSEEARDETSPNLMAFFQRDFDVLMAEAATPANRDFPLVERATRVRMRRGEAATRDD